MRPKKRLFRGGNQSRKYVLSAKGSRKIILIYREWKTFSGGKIDRYIFIYLSKIIHDFIIHPSYAMGREIIRGKIIFIGRHFHREDAFYSDDKFFGNELFSGETDYSWEKDF